MSSRAYLAIILLAMAALCFYEGAYMRKPCEAKGGVYTNKGCFLKTARVDDGSP